MKTKLFLGLGYGTIGVYKAYINKSKTPAYECWTSMIKRCHSTRELMKFPTYKECTIVKEWYNFQIFAEWFYKNHKKGYHLDKDILIKGNKEYGPNTCCFVPYNINILFCKSNKTRGKYPLGIDFQKKNSKFRARISKYNKSIVIGSYNTVTEAFQNYKIHKETHIKEVAKNALINNLIIEKVYNAMIKYNIEIND